MRLASCIAAKYRARCWWAEYDDLRQEAILAMLEAGRTYDATRGPVNAYMWRAACIAVRAFLWRNTAPVNASPHEFEELAGITRQAVDERMLVDEQTPDELLAVHQWRQRVSSTLCAVVYQAHDDRTDDMLVHSVLFREVKPGCVAADSGVPVAHVYQAVKRARRRVSRDLELYNLWRTAPHV